jgi:hypothetical protein
VLYYQNAPLAGSIQIDVIPNMSQLNQNYINKKTTLYGSTMKRGWMLALGIFLLLLPLALSDSDTRTACTNEAACNGCDANYAAQGFSCYCKLQTGTCWVNTTIIGPPGAPPLPPGTQPPNLGGSPTGNTNTPTTNLAGQATGTITLDSLQASLTLLQQQVSSSDTRNQQTISTLQANLNSLQQQVSQLSTQVQSVSLQGSQVGGIRTELSTVSSGLAALQQNLDTTKTELSGVETNLKKAQGRTKLLSGILFSILILAVAALVVYYISGKRRKINPHVVQYITEHIKKGKKYSHVKENLEKVGWAAEDIEWAYKGTMKHNYKKYRKDRTAEGHGPQFDKKKVAAISIVSILIMFSVIFLLKGVTTGQAIHFNTDQELSQGVLQTLQTNIANNQFYSLVHSATICVEVVDGPKKVSYSVTKTTAGHKIDLAPNSCSEDNSYNAAVKFTSFKNFKRMMTSFNCKTARELHSNNRGNRGVYVLPSQLVLPGFKLNPQVNYQQYCPLLRSCLSDPELIVLGCS